MEISAAASLALMLVALVAGAALGYLLALARASSRVTAALTARARAEAELAAERYALAARTEEERAERDRLADRFRALAGDALAANSEQFLGLAEQRLRSSQVSGQALLTAKEEAVRALVEPLAATLQRVAGQVDEAERLRLAGAAALDEHLRAMRESSEALRRETAQLVTALRSSQVRGRWGELQLRRVVEAAGMLNQVDFVEQSQVRTDDGPLRPDMIVRLAGGKQVVVDAKVAFLGYLEAQEATDDAQRAERLRAHARHLRAHVDDLAAKRYWEQFAPAPEFVVMFVPAEAFFHAALEQDGTLMEYAFERNVVIATPMTLLALLRTVAYAWRQEALAGNAQQVLTLGRELHGRLSTLGRHLGRMGRSLDAAAQAYNQTVASLESRVLVSARRFADLRVVDEALPSPPPVDPRLSTLSAVELLQEDMPPAGTGDHAEDEPAERRRADGTSAEGQCAGNELSTA